MAKNVVTLDFDNTDYSFRPYGTCSTPASNIAKVVSITGFTLCEGATVLVKFENNNTALYPTLNINNTGAKSIIGGNLTSGGIYEFVYDGTYWNIIKSDSSKNYHVIDLTSLSQDNFYPVIFNAKHYVNDCEIHSPNVAGTSTYNQNILHFQLHACGYSDTPKSFKVLSYGAYSSSEITIGAVGYGTTAGEHCVWVRGGMKYEFICNIKPVLYADGYSSLEQAFMPGTNYQGGTNAKVTICWSADNPRSEVLSEAATSTKLGGIKTGYTQSGKNYPVQLDSNNKAYVNVPWTDTDTNIDTKNTSGSTNNSSKLYLIGATEQSANPQTYSNSKVYATDGVLTATTFNGNATSATTTTHLAGGAAGSIPYQTAAGTTTMLAKGNNGQVLKISNGVPAWANEYTYTHPDSGATTNSYGPSSNATPTHGGTFEVPYFTINAQGHVTAASTQTITLPADNNTDTKNTAGATNSASKIYLIGATSQGDNPQTYSNSNVYATNGDLVANSFQGSIKGTSANNVNTAYKDLHFQFYNNVTGCDSTVSTDGKRYAGTANSYGFPVSNNANAMLWIGAHSGNYGHQLGFSSDGRIYDRCISNGSFPTTVNGGSWKKIAYTSDIITPEIATETEIKNASWW